MSSGRPSCRNQRVEIDDGLGARPGSLALVRDLGRRDDAVADAAASPPAQRAGFGRPGLVEHEYRRRGTLAYLAALDVPDPQRGLFGHCVPKISSDALVADAMTSESYPPRSAESYASAQRVFWVVDSGAIHPDQSRSTASKVPGRTSCSCTFPGTRRRRNRIEIYFSIVQRKALTPCHFEGLDDLAQRILGFRAEFARTATPFDWTFTRRPSTPCSTASISAAGSHRPPERSSVKRY